VIDFIIKIVTLFFSNSLLQYSIGTACHSCHHITLCSTDNWLSQGYDSLGMSFVILTPRSDMLSLSAMSCSYWLDLSCLIWLVLFCRGCQSGTQQTQIFVSCSKIWAVSRPCLAQGKACCSSWSDICVRKPPNSCHRLSRHSTAAPRPASGHSRHSTAVPAGHSRHSAGQQPASFSL